MSAALNRVDIAGQRFGRLLVLAYAYTSVHKKAIWHCRCDCGKETFVAGPSLRNRTIVSCGCCRDQEGRKNLASRQLENFKHGACNTRTYASWAAAKARCFCITDDHFKNYGARGITMCESWRDSFSNFLTDMGERPGRTTLHRVDNDGNYEPGNCKWATAKEQCENRRQRKNTRPAVKLDYADVSLIKARLRDGSSTTELAAEFGMSTTAIRKIAIGKTWADVE